eukprot:8796348-Pyramimonas_sp.AAC.2
MKLEEAEAKLEHSLANSTHSRKPTCPSRPLHDCVVLTAAPSYAFCVMHTCDNGKSIRPLPTVAVS